MSFCHVKSIVNIVFDPYPAIANREFVSTDFSFLVVSMSSHIISLQWTTPSVEEASTYKVNEVSRYM